MPITAHSIPEPEARAVAAGRPGEAEGETGAETAPRGSSRPAAGDPGSEPPG